MRYRLKELAARKGVTLRKVAEETGISVRVLYYMTSKHNYHTTTRVIEKLCEFFGVTPNELLVVEGAETDGDSIE